MNPIEDILLKDCKQYIQELRKCTKGNLFVRGFPGDIKYFRKFKHNLESRKPRNTPQEIHDKVNDIYVSKLGWKLRNGVFSYGINIINSELYDLGYGSQYLFFPFDNFEFAYSPKFFDLYGYINDPKNPLDSIALDNVIKNLGYINNNVCEIFDTKGSEGGFSNEVAFKTEHYYLINPKLKERIIGLIWSNS